MLRKVVRGGFKKKDGEKLHYKSDEILKITKTEDISTFVKRQVADSTTEKMCFCMKFTEKMEI